MSVTDNSSNLDSLSMGQAGFSPLPYDLRTTEIIPAMEAAIGSLAVLQSKLQNNPHLTQAAHLIQQADTILAQSIDCSEDELLNFLIYKAKGSEDPPLSNLRVPVNYLNTLEAGFSIARDRPSTAFKITEIQNLHRILAHSIAIRGSAGELYDNAKRASLNSLTASARSPNILVRMQDLENFLTTPPWLAFVIKLAMVYAQLEIISPFSYGNGDMARVVTQMMLVAEGYPAVPMSTLLAEKKDLVALELASLRKTAEWHRWVNVFLGIFAEAIHKFCEILDKLDGIRLQWYATLRVRKDASARSIVDMLIGKPIITVSNVQKKFEISFQTANSALSSLNDYGIVSIVQRGGAAKRNRVFYAPEVIRTVIELLYDP